jgi:hypothetical protein
MDSRGSGEAWTGCLIALATRRRGRERTPRAERQCWKSEYCHLWASECLLSFSRPLRAQAASQPDPVPTVAPTTTQSAFSAPAMMSRRVIEGATERGGESGATGIGAGRFPNRGMSLSSSSSSSSSESDIMAGALKADWVVVGPDSPPLSVAPSITRRGPVTNAARLFTADELAVLPEGLLASTSMPTNPAISSASVRPAAALFFFAFFANCFCR